MTSRKNDTVEELSKAVRGGDRAALPRAITLLESTRADHREQAQRLLLELTPQGLPDRQGCRPAAMVVADMGAPPAGPALWCVLNKGRGRLLQHGPRRVLAATGLPVAATVPLDTRNVGAAEDARLPLTVARPRSPAATVLAGVAARLLVALADMGAAGDTARGAETVAIR